MAIKWNTRLISDMKAAVSDGVEDATTEVYEEVLRLVQDTPKTGFIYKNRLHKNANHQASAPGESYSNETGNALKNTKREVVRYTGTVTGAYEYALALELGTQNMAPRPTIGRALLNKRKDLVEIISKPLKDVLKR